MADAMEPAEPAVMKGRFEGAVDEYECLFGRLAGHMAAEWQLLDALLTPIPVDAARARYAAPTRTATAGNAYGVVAHPLTPGLDAMRDPDLTPSENRADPAGVTALPRTAPRLVCTAAATTAGQAAPLSRSDADRPAFVTALEAVVAQTCPSTRATGRRRTSADGHDKLSFPLPEPRRSPWLQSLHRRKVRSRPRPRTKA
ncbi:hypothetical protein [Streptomyces sp. NPDC056949]|uniref:hypothetical protein n=1 Tax=Streptomyces sp. NPDC056949 TaxID=3345976 RepID=UPI00363B99F8